MAMAQHAFLDEVITAGWPFRDCLISGIVPRDPLVPG